MKRTDHIMRGITSSPKDGRLRHAWLIARASFAHCYRYPGPDDKPIGFWYSLRGAWEIFWQYATKEEK